MPKLIDPVALLSAVAVTAKESKSYPAETHVIAIEQIRQILFELQERKPEQLDAETP